MTIYKIPTIGQFDSQIWDTLAHMPRQRADALRAEVGDRLIRQYGDLKHAAEAMETPYKTLYRTFTASGKDRTQTVSLESIIAIVEHLRRHEGGDDLGVVWDAAMNRLPQHDDYALAASDDEDWERRQEAEAE